MSRRLYEDVLRLVLRMTTRKEGEVGRSFLNFSVYSFINYLLGEVSCMFQKEWISREEFGKILREQGIFDVGRMIDIAAVFTPNQGRLIERMMDNILLAQPKFKSDISRMASGAVKEVRRLSSIVLYTHFLKILVSFYLSQTTGIC